MPNIGSQFQGLLYGIYTIKKIVSLDRNFKRKSKAKKMLDMKNIDFHNFLEKQYKIYVEFDKTLEIIKIINTMFDDVAKKQEEFRKNAQQLKEFFIDEFIEINTLEEFSKHIPKAKLLLTRIRKLRKKAKITTKFNVNLKTVQINHFQIKFMDTKYILSGGETLVKPQEIKYGNEALIYMFISNSL